MAVKQPCFDCIIEVIEKGRNVYLNQTQIVSKFLYNNTLVVKITKYLYF